MEKADRYTVLTSTFDALGGYLEACSLLGLVFFVKGEPRYSDRCMVYVFFDEVGLRNYLNGCYDENIAELIGSKKRT